MESQVLFPILTLLIGWVLAQLSVRVGERRQARLATGRVLTDLLEIRFRLLSIAQTLTELKKRLPIPDEALPVLRAVFQQILPVSAGLHERYEHAVLEIAGTDPALAYAMRAQDQVPQLLSWLDLVAAGSPEGAALYSRLEPKLFTAVTDALAERIRRCARLHGWSTCFRIHGVLRRQSSLTPEAGSFFDEIERQVKVHFERPSVTAKPNTTM